jgi:hypothetical protein
LPVVALLDGVPLSNHEALRGRLIIDDPDEFDSLYRSPQEHMHGTAMASLILHGDLNNPEEGSLFRPLYVRPVMAPEREQRSGRDRNKFLHLFYQRILFTVLCYA